MIEREFCQHRDLVHALLRWWFGADGTRERSMVEHRWFFSAVTFLQPYRAIGCLDENGSGWTGAADPPPVEVVEMLDEEWPGGATGIMFMTGRSDRVLDRLEAQYSGMAPFGPSISLWGPSYDPLRDDPRFQAILASRGLEGLKPQRLEPGEVP